MLCNRFNGKFCQWFSCSALAVAWYGRMGIIIVISASVWVITARVFTAVMAMAAMDLAAMGSAVMVTAIPLTTIRLGMRIRQQWSYPQRRRYTLSGKKRNRLNRPSQTSRNPISGITAATPMVTILMSKAVRAAGCRCRRGQPVNNAKKKS